MKQKVMIKYNEFKFIHESNFIGVNKLIVLDYTNAVNNVKRFSTRKYYLLKG